MKSAEEILVDTSPYLQRFLPVISFAIFLLFAFLSFSGPISDGDFFWHLKTGEWIWQHQALPQADPFPSIVDGDISGSSPSLNERFFLQGYWLAQLIFYGIWQLFGPAGIVLLRASLYIALIAFIFVWTEKKSSSLIAFIMVLLLAALLREFPNERPQLFTFFLTPLVIYLLERTRKTSPREATSKYLSLPFVMLIWPNIHGGYVLGVALILIYALGEVIEAIFNRRRLPAEFIVLCFVSVLATLLNPNTYRVYSVLAGMGPGDANGNYEFLSPVTVALKMGEYYAPYFLFLFGACMILVLRFRQMDMTHRLVIIFLAGLSLSGLRYMPYLLMTAPLLAGYMPKQRSKYDTAAILSLTILGIFLINRGASIELNVNSNFPAKAASFIQRELPKGNVFHYYDWGGYLMYALPQYRVFIDGRGLSAKANTLYDGALWTDNWRGAFRDFDIQIVVIPGISQVSGVTFTLVWNLLQASDWFLLYRDAETLCFVQESPRNAKLIEKYAENKELVYDHIIGLASRGIEKNSLNPGLWRSRAEAMLAKGNTAGAMVNYTMVLKLAPNDERAQNALRWMGGNTFFKPEAL
jgi:hypothetical protein